MKMPGAASIRWMWLGILILLIAGFARLYLFGDVPPGLQHDEIFKAQEGRALIEQGDFRMFYPSNQGHEGLYVWLLGVSYALFGTSVLMIKFPAFVCGLLTVAVVYRVIGQAFNRRVGAVTAGLIAVSLWAVFVNRVGLRANMLPLFGLLVVGGLWRLTAHRMQSRQRWILAVTTGAALGLSIYTYTSAFALFVAFGLFVFTLLLFQRKTFRQRWRELLVVGVLGLFIAAPMVWIRLSDPQGVNRVSTINRPLTSALNGDPAELVDNFWKLAGMPYFTGDPEWRYNIAGRPLFSTPVGLLVYVGFGLALWRVRRQPMLTLFLAFATAGLIPSLLTVAAPSYLRSILALPAVMLFVALSLDVIRDKRIVGVAGIAVITLTAVTDWHAYFNTWPYADEVHAIYRDDLEALARYVSSEDVPRVLASTTDTELDSLLFGYLQPPDDTGISFFDGTTTMVLSDQPATLLISPLSAITPPHADWLTAAQGTLELPPLLRKDGAVAYNLYQLDASTALYERLAQMQTRAVYVYNETAFPRGGVENWAEGIEYPVNFGNIIELVGVDLPRTEIATEHDGVNIQLYLHPLIERQDLPLNVFVHMARLDGTVHAQRDLLGVPALQWTRDLYFIQDNFVIAGSTPPGRYIITMGIYNFQTGERLPILAASGQVIADRLVIDRLRAVAAE
jgi:4-amino-4-deoxy-L-arabinose transferase-like glycosyltransferase